MKDRSIYKEFGLRLRELRGGVTQKEFAKKIGVTERAYQKYEYGERFPKFEILLNIADLCDVPVINLLPKVKKAGKGLVSTDPATSQKLHDLHYEGNQRRFELGQLDEAEEGVYLDSKVHELYHKICYVREYTPESVGKYLSQVIETFVYLTSKRHVVIKSLGDDLEQSKGLLESYHDDVINKIKELIGLAEKLGREFMTLTHRQKTKRGEDK